MTRVKKGINALKRRRSVLKRVKGYRFARSKKERAAKEAIFHAGTYAFAHRRDKKGDFRRLWNVRLNAILKENGLSYSKFINLLKKNDVSLDRKILSEIAQENPETFKSILSSLS
ncbi:MAG TPA: 50S ribosomal protein L20 [Candidatus Paceibacterota bacterium]